MGQPISSAKLRALAEAMDHQDSIRSYWFDADGKGSIRSKPSSIDIRIFDGSALQGNKEFCRELEKQVLEKWNYLFQEVMKKLQHDVNNAAADVDLIIRNNGE